MSEIVDDLKVANVEVTSNLGIRLSGSAPEIKTTQTLAPLVVTAGGDLTLESTAGAVNVIADGRIDLNSNDVVVGNPAGTVDIDSNTVVIGNPAGTVDIDSNSVTIGNSGGSIGFYGIGPVTQHNTNGNVAVTAAGGTDAVYRNTTFTGSEGDEAYTIGDIVRALKMVGLLAKGAL